MLRGSSSTAKRCRKKVVMRLASGLSSFASCLTADSASSIRQAKIALYLTQRINPLLAFTDTLQHVRGEVVVL